MSFFKIFLAYCKVSEVYQNLNVSSVYPFLGSRFKFYGKNICRKRPIFISFQLQNAALRTTLEDVCLHVWGHQLFGYLLKKSSGNPYLKILNLTQHSFADAPMKFSFETFRLTPSHSTFGTPSTKYFFAYDQNENFKI